MRHIPISIACEKLGVESCTMINSAKYNQFYKRSDNGTKNASFDMDGYLKYDDIKNTLTEKVKLMVEYLHHIEGISYTKLSVLTGVHVQAIALHTFAYKKALRIALYVREFMPFQFKRFDEYYTWKATDKKPKFKHTIYGWRKI